jgi:glycosyltransferase involved in cell wall biosynthesis
MGTGGLIKAVRRKIASAVYPGGYWERYSQDARSDATFLDFSIQDIIQSQRLSLDFPGKIDIGNITWFLPEFSHPYFGGIYTILRFAEYFRREKGIENRFAILGSMDENRAAELIEMSFPGLVGEDVRTFDLYEQVNDFKPSDVGIATLWSTAYPLLRFNQTKRKFYFVQDYEPLFYPAGSISAQVDASYSFGYYCIANTPTIKEIYENTYGGKAQFFYPSVDTDVFYPEEKGTNVPTYPTTLFFYGRPQHPRNGFELGAQALRILKRRMRGDIHIVSAGAEWHPGEYDLAGVVENLGLLDYKETAKLYRKCQAGLIMMFTRHPSYLPFELMASGCLVVSNFNPSTTWFLKDRENSRLSRASATCLADILEESLTNTEERVRISGNGVQFINNNFSDWVDQIEKIYQFMCAPNAVK